MKKVYYNQADSRWASHPYPSSLYPNATVKSSGCGTTCAAMIVSSTKEIIYPDAMSDISRQNGYRAATGTADALFDYVANRWGFEIKRLHSSYEAHQACKEGWFVVICCSNGLWTTGGHYILAVGAKDDKIEIYDPYLYNGKFNINGRQGKVTLDGNTAWVQIDTFKQYSNAQRFIAFNVGKAITDGVSDAGSSTSNGEVRYVNVNTSLNVRSGIGTNSPIVGTLSRGTQVIEYETNSGWSRIGNSEWVSSQYLSAEPVDMVKPQPVYKKAYVTASALNVRSGPGVGNPVVSTKKRSDEVTIYEEQNGWSRIDVGQWVSSQYLSATAVVAEQATKTMYVKVSTSLNIRKSPDGNSAKVGSLSNGTKVTVYAEQNGWSKIGTNQWVSSTYLTSSNKNSAKVSTVGQTKRFKSAVTLYAKSNLSGTKYNYKAGTSVKILQNVSSSVDKVYISATGRTAYCKNNVYA